MQVEVMKREKTSAKKMPCRMVILIPNHKKSCINGNFNLIKYFSGRETTNTKGKRKQKGISRPLSAMTHSENSGIHE